MSSRRLLRKHNVWYQPKIRDWDGKETSYTFQHHIPHEAFGQAVAKPDAANALAQDIALEHYDELLTDRHWRCCNCGGTASRLVMHPLPYLHLVQPTIADMPAPVCPSSYCEKAHLEQYRNGLGGVLNERVHTKSVVAAVAALMALAVVIGISVI
eukprot:GHUV01009952.1.p1 GENE.GHUV01009952.1~~GHUV01009952.1.p1  ORF type:complete len:155 (+),score=13.15 GHUV01009952.1:614-1078(+)